MGNFKKTCIFLASFIVGLMYNLKNNAQTISYSYDALGRLIIVSHDNADDRLYEYDDAGNRISVTVYEDGNVANTPPVCNSWSTTVSSGTTSTSINPVAGHCSDIDGHALTLTNVTSPASGATATVSGSYIMFSGLPYGVTSVTFTVSDGNGGSDSAVLNVTRPFGGGNGWPMCGEVIC